MTPDEKYILAQPPENLTPYMLKTRIRLRDEQFIAWGTNETLELIFLLIFIFDFSLIGSWYVWIISPLILGAWIVLQAIKTKQYNKNATELDIQYNPVAYLVVRDNIDLNKYMYIMAFTCEFANFEKEISKVIEDTKLFCKKDISKECIDYIYAPYRKVANDIADGKTYHKVWVEKPEGWDDRLKVEGYFSGLLEIKTYYYERTGKSVYDR